MADGTIFVDDVIGRAWDAPTASYYIDGKPESVIGVEITDLGGMLEVPHIGIFITCHIDGRKAFLTAGAARNMAESLVEMADRLEAGATSARDDA